MTRDTSIFGSLCSVLYFAFSTLSVLDGMDVLGVDLERNMFWE